MVMVLEYLVMHSSDDQCWHATGGTFALPNEYKAAKPEVSTPRQPRESDSYVCAFRLPAPASEVFQQCGAVRRDVQPQHVVECRRVPCACVPFDVRAGDHAPVAS